MNKKQQRHYARRGKVLRRIEHQGEVLWHVENKKPFPGTSLWKQTYMQKQLDNWRLEH